MICRRDLRFPPRFPPGRLIGTRGAWMTRFDAVEFTKFVTLTKDLSPFVLLLIDPQSRSRRQDRNPATGKFNLGDERPSRRGAVVSLNAELVASRRYRGGKIG